MLIDLRKRRALVTGSTSGIGYAIAKGLAASGAQVTLHGHSDASVAAARATLAADVPGAEIAGHAAELADAGAVDALVAAVPDVDILVANGGPFASGPFVAMTADDWRRYLDVYVTATATLARHYLPKMIEAGWGRILCSGGVTCSYTSNDRDAATTMTAWLTAKAAVIGLARGLAEIAAGTAVTVNSFIPGPAHTPEAHARHAMKPGYERFSADYFAGAGRSSLVQRFLAPDEIANVVVFLASPQASAITGAALRVDGGILRTIL